jgi:hypothetical protein
MKFNTKVWVGSVNLIEERKKREGKREAAGAASPCMPGRNGGRPRAKGKSIYHKVGRFAQGLPHFSVFRTNAIFAM